VRCGDGRGSGGAVLLLSAVYVHVVLDLPSSTLTDQLYLCNTAL